MPKGGVLPENWADSAKIGIGHRFHQQVLDHKDILTPTANSEIIFPKHTLVKTSAPLLYI
jgi:hypothetical protein